MTIEFEDIEKYRGEFVTIEDFGGDQKVLAHGENPRKVFKEAKNICEDPILFYVPRKGQLFVFRGGKCAVQ